MTRLRHAIAALCAALVIRLPCLLEWRGAAEFFRNSATGSRGWGGGWGYPRFRSPAPGTIDQDIRSHVLSGPAAEWPIGWDPAEPDSFRISAAGRRITDLRPGLPDPPPRAAPLEQKSPSLPHGYMEGELLTYRHTGPFGCGRTAFLYAGLLTVYQPWLLRSEKARLPGSGRPATGAQIACASCNRPLEGARCIELAETAEDDTPWL